MDWLFAILTVAVCYLIGSVPTAYILVKAVKGTDIRSLGSGNVGATNAGRALGRWAFVFVLIADTLKGFLPLWLMSHYFSGYNINILLFAAFALILGHTFPVFLRFKGGKGVATGLGVFLALAPAAVGIALIVFILVALATRMISAGSVVAALALAVSVQFLYMWPGLKIFTWFMAAFVIYKHIPNIKRILDGTENRIKLGR